MKVGGRQRVVDVGEDGARERAGRKGEDRQLELQRAVHELRGDLVDEVAERDDQRRSVDARQPVELVEADARVSVPGAAGGDEHALAGQVWDRVVGVREVDAFDEPAQPHVAGHGRQAEAGVSQKLAHGEDAGGALRLAHILFLPSLLVCRYTPPRRRVCVRVPPLRCRRGYSITADKHT